jgi:hypothetical protein
MKEINMPAFTFTTRPVTEIIAMIEKDQQVASDAIINLERQRSALLLTLNSEMELARLDREIAWLGVRLDNLACSESEMLAKIKGLEGRERDSVMIRCAASSTP